MLQYNNAHSCMPHLFPLHPFGVFYFASSQGDEVFYFPVGHAAFSEKHPDPREHLRKTSHAFRKVYVSRFCSCAFISCAFISMTPLLVAVLLLFHNLLNGMSFVLVFDSTC